MSDPQPSAPEPILAPVPVRPRRLIYLGTPDVAVPPLRALVAAGFDVALVITRADKRRGRGTTLSPSPVKAAATELGLPVSHRVDDALQVDPDLSDCLGVVVAFGQLIKPHVLEKLAFVNLHFSLLPRWRGAAPVERALLAGDAETGVDLMRLEVGLDTGPIFARTVVPIEPRATLTSLRTELVRIGSDMLVSELRRGLGAPIDQVGEPTYASKIDPTELEIDWSLPVERIDRLVRLGGAWTTFRGKRLKIIEASLVANDAATAPTLVPVTVQPEGKAPMTFSAWRNGARPDADELFGS